MTVCANCHILLRANLERFEYLAVNMTPDSCSILEGWIGREVTANDRLCTACVTLVIRAAANEMEYPGSGRGRLIGHSYVCIRCSISLNRRTGRVRRRLLPGSLERNYIQSWIWPRVMPVDEVEEVFACNTCWSRAHRNAPMPGPADAVPEAGPVPASPPLPTSAGVLADALVPAASLVAAAAAVPAAAPEAVPRPREPEAIVPQHPVADMIIIPDSEPEVSTAPPSSMPSSETASWAVPIVQPHLDITLPNYRRTSENPDRCFVPECVNPERNRVPQYLRRAILREQKVFVTSNSRVCQEHSMLYDWEMLEVHQFSSRFTATQIEEMLTLLSSISVTNILNFENIQNMDDTLCHYWTGRTPTQFLTMFNSVPLLGNICKKAKTALGMYLVKLRTGESMARMASLFLIGTTTVSTYIKKVRNCLNENYVPHHLGIGHISRAALSARNLLIPNGLFGTEENNPIVICDGTYIYVQKSSNYLYQKETWSLHKYQNLVKPFLIVACDGHIVDAFGPYPATTSDATIMRNLFQDPNGPLRSYFRENDSFILDRGFRDAIPLLESLGYSIYKPETLDAGETQLSTIKANRSRLVTMCRWVVETINGKYKRDYKLFRHKYFNVYSKNLMTDFRIASAIINDFHPVYTDRPDAHLILDRALSRVEMSNTLADAVIQQRINRDRANFVGINAQLPELHVFPVMEMQDLILFSLGTYQIRQARSYYGEHIRDSGTFDVEVDGNLITFEENQLLLRGRIKSRHTTNRRYFTYILLNLNGESWEQKIEGYYCSCIIGKRTVGCCAHVMTVVWYLGWARHQDSVLPPAQFLDEILVREDFEEDI